VRILLIDDDETIRDMVTRFLEGRGHEVDTHPLAIGLPGRVADWWRGKPAPDAIILDITMPEMSGDTALKLLARNPTSREVPVVLYSAINPIDGEALTPLHPKCRFVPKTDRLSDLLAVIDELVTA
jgi:CheY-like chemotaxis protein